MRVHLVLAALLVVPFVPAASSSHVGCEPPTTPATQTVETGGVALYVLLGSGEASLYRESNGIPGLQRDGGCGHARDSQLMHVCARLDLRIPGTILCLVETA